MSEHTSGIDGVVADSDGVNGWRGGLIGQARAERVPATAVPAGDVMCLHGIGGYDETAAGVKIVAVNGQGIDV
jgi:hypothetical protein